MEQDGYKQLLFQLFRLITVRWRLFSLYYIAVRLTIHHEWHDAYLMLQLKLVRFELFALHCSQGDRISRKQNLWKTGLWTQFQRKVKWVKLLKWWNVGLKKIMKYCTDKKKFTKTSHSRSHMFIKYSNKNTTGTLYLTTHVQTLPLNIIQPANTLVTMA